MKNYNVETLIEILEVIPVGIIIINENNNILLYNKKFIDMWEIPADVLNQLTMIKLFDYMQTKTTTCLQYLQNFKHTNPVIYEIKMNNGIYLEQYVTSKKNNIIYSFYDISAKKRLENVLEQQTMLDPLTELPNKNLLIDRLQQYIANAQRNNSYIAVLFFGLNMFQAIYDNFGNSIAEQLLKACGQRLKTNVRAQDTVARLSNDEFVVVVTSKTFNLESFYKIIQRLFEHILQPYKLDNQEIILAFNLGISFYPQDGKDPETLIKNSSIAMYDSKDAGKNTLKVYNEEDSVHNFLFTFLSGDNV